MLKTFKWLYFCEQMKIARFVTQLRVSEREREIEKKIHFIFLTNEINNWKLRKFEWNEKRERKTQIKINNGEKPNQKERKFKAQKRRDRDRDNEREKKRTTQSRRI